MLKSLEDGYVVTVTNVVPLQVELNAETVSDSEMDVLLDVNDVADELVSLQVVS